MERIKEKRIYEFVSLISGRLTKQEAEAEALRIHDLIRQLGGEITASEKPAPHSSVVPPGLGIETNPAPANDVSPVKARTLAYRIAHETVAQECLVRFRAYPEVVGHLTEALRHNAALLRSFVFKKKAPPTAPPKRPRPPRETTAHPEAIGAAPAHPPAPPPITVADIDKKLEELIG